MKITYKTLNIFSDCSTTDVKSSTATISPGFIILKGYDEPKRIDNKIINNSTSSYGEEYAIMMGLQSAYKIYERNPEEVDRVNIFSDNLPVIELYRHINKKYSFIDCFDAIEMVKKDSYFLDSKIHYYDLFEKIFTTVGKFKNIPIRFYHVSGHTRYSVTRDLNLMMSKFKKYNGEKISKDLAVWICKNNVLIDTKTRSRLNDTITSKVFRTENYNKKKEPIQFLITPEEYMRYMANTM